MRLIAGTCDLALEYVSSVLRGTTHGAELVGHGVSPPAGPRGECAGGPRDSSRVEPMEILDV